MSRPRAIERGQVVRPKGGQPWVMREPHFLVTQGTYEGPVAAGEFVVRVRSVGEVTVTPGRDASVQSIIDSLRDLALYGLDAYIRPGQKPPPPEAGTAAAYHARRILYHEDRPVTRVGTYPDGATLHWGLPPGERPPESEPLRMRGDWYEWPCSPEDRERAKRERAKADAVGPVRFKSKDAWTGHAGEYAVEDLLTRIRVPHRKYGGINDKPDIAVKGAGLAVKTRNSYVAWRRAFYLPVPDRQEPHGDHFVFCVYEHATNLILVLGGLSVEDFRAVAAPMRKGEIMESDREATYDFHRVQADDLATVIPFFGAIAGRAIDPTRPGG